MKLFKKKKNVAVSTDRTTSRSPNSNWPYFVIKLYASRIYRVIVMGGKVYIELLTFFNLQKMVLEENLQPTSKPQFVYYNH